MDKNAKRKMNRETIHFDCVTTVFKKGNYTNGKFIYSEKMENYSSLHSILWWSTDNKTLFIECNKIHKYIVTSLFIIKFIFFFYEKRRRKKTIKYIGITIRNTISIIIVANI